MHISDKLKAQVVWALKERGDIESFDGRSHSILHERLLEMGVNVTQPYVAGAARVLEEEGRITRQVDSGKRVRSLRFVDVGEYEDPIDPETMALNASKPRIKQRGNKGLDAALAAIDKLTLPEKLMIAGQIVDDCAGEVDDTYTKLRTVLGGI